MILQRPVKGFTLLELLMVVSIMSATAYVALGTLENDGDNRRYQATVDNLEIIRKALLGLHPSLTQGQWLPSGYVADNGGLSGINSANSLHLLTDAGLHSRPDGFIENYGLQAPRFDSSPDAATGINNSDDIVRVCACPDLNPTVCSTNKDSVLLNCDKQLLLKGYRSSGYVDRRPGNEGLSDGWGGDWQVSTIADDGSDRDGDGDTGADDLEGIDGSWRLLSYGGNGKVDSVIDSELFNIFDKDVVLQVMPEDWQIELAGWEVTVANFSGADVSVPLGQCLRLSLLVFINDAKEYLPEPTETQHWKRLTSACLAGNTNAGSCLDGDGDDAVGGAVCPSSATVVFPAQGGGDGDYQPPTRIPQGEHLLVLLTDTDPSDAHNDESESVHGTMTSRKVRFYAKAARPDAMIVIR